MLRIHVWAQIFYHLYCVLIYAPCCFASLTQTWANNNGWVIFFLIRVELVTVPISWIKGPELLLFRTESTIESAIWRVGSDYALNDFTCLRLWLIGIEKPSCILLIEVDVVLTSTAGHQACTSRFRVLIASMWLQDTAQLKCLSSWGRLGMLGVRVQIGLTLMSVLSVSHREWAVRERGLKIRLT